MTWYRHAMAYAELKWPRLAPHSRASLADALATVTPLLTRETGRRPPEGTVRAALYGHAFNPQQRRSRAPDPGTVGTLAWLERVSLPVSQLSDPHVIRTALDGLCTRLDGSPAAANTISRKRAVFHAALGYAVELGLLPANPVEKVRWHAPRAAVAVSPAAVASPAQVRAILAQVSRVRPELAAFFSCLYYAALRPEEAVAVRREDLILPAHGRGTIILTAACPRTGTAWTSTGGPHETRGLKHRPDGTIRVVPIPSVLVRICAVTCVLRHRAGRAAVPRHPRGHAQRVGLWPRLAHRPPGRARPGPGCHRARASPLRPAARCPVLVAQRQRGPAEVAARAGNSTRVLHEVYLHCTDGKEDLVSQRIEDALDADGSAPAVTVRESKRLYTPSAHARPCPLSVREPAPVPRIAHGRQDRQTRVTTRRHRAHSVSAAQKASKAVSAESGRFPDPAHA